MVEGYDGYTFSSEFSDADIHWHLWNEVIEKMKTVDIYDEHEMENFTTADLKFRVLDAMVDNDVVREGSLRGCVLCVVEGTCDTCPLGRCFKEGSLYNELGVCMREARTKRCGEYIDYVMIKRCIDEAIEIAEEIRDILCSK